MACLSSSTKLWYPDNRFVQPVVDRICLQFAKIGTRYSYVRTWYQILRSIFLCWRLNRDACRPILPFVVWKELISTPVLPFQPVEERRHQRLPDKALAKTTQWTAASWHPPGKLSCVAQTQQQRNAPAASSKVPASVSDRVQLPAVADAGTRCLPWM